jgi:hypothetical protein
VRVLTALFLLAVGSTPTAVVPASPMSAPRAAHSATLLRSGEVLIAGGCAIDGCERDARGAETELFDPATGRFRAGPRLQRPRVGHAAFRLPDGRVVIAGGWQGTDPTAGTEIYDPARDSIAAGPAMTAPRGGFTVSPLGRGRFLIAGGSDGRRVLASAEIFDSASLRFRRTGSMGSPRDAHAAAPLGRGRVLVTGGRDTRDVVLSKTEVYDARKGRFVRGPAIPRTGISTPPSCSAEVPHSSSADRTAATSTAGMRAPSGTTRGPAASVASAPWPSVGSS